MKKAIMVLSILCGGLLIANPIMTTFAQGQNTTVIENKSDGNNVEVIKELNIEQAKDILKMRNDSIDYTYQGDENTFDVLKDKGLEGYVFLGNVDGDLGYFVDKNSVEIYYFHPSGYLEVI